MTFRGKARNGADGNVTPTSPLFWPMPTSSNMMRAPYGVLKDRVPGMPGGCGCESRVGLQHGPLTMGIEVTGDVGSIPTASMSDTFETVN
jgi:hypothetical protein